MPAPPDLQPLFPLPNVVLFPKGILPPHLFEPRYRTMMADALKGGQTICMGQDLLNRVRHRYPADRRRN